jgi:hypothetical protein
VIFFLLAAWSLTLSTPSAHLFHLILSFNMYL